MHKHRSLTKCVSPEEVKFIEQSELQNGKGFCQAVWLLWEDSGMVRERRGACAPREGFIPSLLPQSQNPGSKTWHREGKKGNGPAVKEGQVGWHVTRVSEKRRDKAGIWLQQSMLGRGSPTRGVACEFWNTQEWSSIPLPRLLKSTECQGCASPSHSTDVQQEIHI